jgi:hypothetical protein
MLGGAALQRCDKDDRSRTLSEAEGNLLFKPAEMNRVERTLLSAAFDPDFVRGAPSPKYAWTDRVRAALQRRDKREGHDGTTLVVPKSDEN